MESKAAAAAKKVLIIGGGIGGLSTGIYAQMNGFESEIFDMHPQQLGGLLYSWKRKNYTIEGCIHHMIGSGPKDPLSYQMYQEIGAFSEGKTHFHDSLVKIEDPFERFGKSPKNSFGSVELFTNIEKLENSLYPMANAKADLDLLKDYVKLVKIAKNEFNESNFLTQFESSFNRNGKLKNTALVLKNMKNIYKFIYKGFTPLKEFGEKFSNPFLRNAVPTFQYDVSEVPLFVNANFVANMDKDFGTIIGGGNKLAQNLEKRYKDLGGKITYGTKIQKILTENVQNDASKPNGIVLGNGKIANGDIVVSCCDGFYTFNTLLNHNDPKSSEKDENSFDPAKDWKKYSTPKALKYYSPKNFPKDVEMSFTVAMGIKRTFPEIPFLYTFFLPKGQEIQILGRTVDHLMVENFTYDKSFAGEGKTVLKLSMKANYPEWASLRRTDMKEYNLKKQIVGDKVIEALNLRFPGLKNDVEMLDISTPATVHRYTNMLHGSLPWMTPEVMGAMYQEQFMEIPKLKNFYHAGQWGRGTLGLNVTAMSGRNVVKKMCDDNNKPFVTKKINQ